MNIKLDKMRYQNNNISYYFGLLALVFNVIYLFKVLNMLTPSLTVAIKIILNIILILVTFLASEKTKAYSKPYSFVMVFFGILSLLRILYVPMQVSNGVVIQKSGEPYPLQTLITLYVYLITMAACFFISGIVGYLKHQQLNKYLVSISNQESKNIEVSTYE